MVETEVGRAEGRAEGRVVVVMVVALEAARAAVDLAAGRAALLVAAAARVELEGGPRRGSHRPHNQPSKCRCSPRRCWCNSSALHGRYSSHSRHTR